MGVDGLAHPFASSINRTTDSNLKNEVEPGLCLSFRPQARMKDP
jgi:hypothetical protein